MTHPFFTREVQAEAQKHLAADPSNFVGLILGASAFIKSVGFIETDNPRSVRVLAESGIAVIIDRTVILGFEMGTGRKLPEETQPPETDESAEAFSEEWVEALKRLRGVASKSKDKGVVDALAALVQIEQAPAADAAEGGAA